MNTRAFPIARIDGIKQNIKVDIADASIKDYWADLNAGLVHDKVAEKMAEHLDKLLFDPMKEIDLEADPPRTKAIQQDVVTVSKVK